MLSCLWNIESAGVGPWATRAGFPKLFKILTAYLPLFKKPINGFAEMATFQRIWNEWENRQELEVYLAHCAGGSSSLAESNVDAES
jgi:hypothetical protein